MADDIARFLFHLLRLLLTNEDLRKFISSNMGMLIIAIIFVVIIVIYAVSTNQQSLPSYSNPNLNPNPNGNGNTNLPHVPDDINNILIDLVKNDIKDPVSQDSFRPGEKIYLCSVHRLAYHEDSWQEIDSKCITCGHGSNAKAYTIPSLPTLSTSTNDLIQFKDVIQPQKNKPEIDWIDYKKP